MNKGTPSHVHNSQDTLIRSCNPYFFNMKFIFPQKVTALMVSIRHLACSMMGSFFTSCLASDGYFPVWVKLLRASPSLFLSLSYRDDEIKSPLPEERILREQTAFPTYCLYLTICKLSLKKRARTGITALPDLQ